MKKLLSLLSVAALLLCLLSTAAYAATGVAGSIDAYGNQEDGYTLGEAGGAPATVISPDGTVYVDGNDVAYTGGKVVVTKSPTGEKVEKGGSASFTAYASSGAQPTWRLISSDTLETIYAAGASQFFDNLVVEGANTNRLTLKNIGDNLNGWQVEAMFDDGEGGHVYSAGARITVVGSTANGTTTDKNPYGRTVAVGGNGNAPSINGQPTGATLTSGRSTTLSVTAGTNDGGDLHYQWYVAGNAEMTDGQAIAGATSASYTPGELPGTRYYYAGVWSEKDGVKSETVYSEVAAVTYPAASPTPAPSQTPAANTSNTGTSNTSNTGTSNTNTNNTTNNTTNSTNTGNNTTGSNNAVVPAPSSTPETEATPEPSPAAGVSASQVSTENRSSLPVVLGAIAAVALAAGVGLLVMRRNAGQ